MSIALGPMESGNARRPGCLVILPYLPAPRRRDKRFGLKEDGLPINRGRNHEAENSCQYRVSHGRKLPFGIPSCDLLHFLEETGRAEGSNGRYSPLHHSGDAQQYRHTATTTDELDGLDLHSTAIQLEWPITILTVKPLWSASPSFMIGSLAPLILSMYFWISLAICLASGSASQGVLLIRDRLPSLADSRESVRGLKGQSG